MKTKTCLKSLLLALVLLTAPVTSFANTNGLVASWHFDEGSGRATTEVASGKQDPFVGHLMFEQGVRGSGLKFDGFTSRLARPAKELPKFGPALAVEAWVAPQEYSWGWTGIVDHDQDARSGFFLGINHLGQVGFYAAVDGKWLGCDSKEPLALLKWAHVAGTFDPATGFRLYVNGQPVGANEAKGDFTPAEGLDLLIGMAHRQQYPALTEREPSKKLLSNMVFDGLMDEVRIYARALTADEIETSFTENSPANPHPLQFRVLPSGPPGPRPFGAFYTRLSYCPEWDRLWRVGDVADVLVCFDELPVRMVFWRGTGYCPAWVTENGKWVSDQSPESWNWNTWGCFEHMSDKRCEFSHVRILENSDARTVVHWRVASASINYDFNHVDPDTRWGEWTDEYYTIYPDAVAVRYQEVRSTWAANMEWQQTELLNQPGTRPQDNVELEAMTIANMDGETETWSWEKPYGKRASGTQPIKNGNIQVMNLKAPQRHFVIGEAGAYWKAFDFGAREGFSTMPCWNHWPVAQLPNDGRVTPAVDRPSSTCLGTLYPVKHKTDRDDLMIGRNLYGLTAKPARELAVLARSWNFPAELKRAGGAFESLGYDKNQRAYVLAGKPAGAPAALEFTLAGSPQSAVLNPAFLVKNWGDANVELTLDGKAIPRGKDFRYGHRQTLDGTDLIVWIKTETQVLLNLRIEPQRNP
jgi:hypothetical protein